MSPLISLVSGTYNRRVMLETMVWSFINNVPKGMEYEIVLVDGGSTDDTLTWIKTMMQYHPIKLIEDGDLLGAISAFTRGGFAATGKYVLFANDDVTFKKHSIMPAITHLENNMKCGAVAFEDNRPIEGYWTDKEYKTLRMAALVDGRPTSVVYAQVGLYRKWLGDKLKWWLGEHDEMAGAQVYAGDNSLSAQIWNKGYSVDPVPGCVVEDHVANDELRQINYHKGLKANDSHFFYDQWPFGVIVMSEPQIPQQDRRAARILYLPIYEPGWAVQKHPVHGKNGLRKALMRAKNRYGVPHMVQEVDYLSAPPNELRTNLMRICEQFRPDLILTQIQASRPISADLLSDMKSISGATVVNWNGDQAYGGLFGPDLLPLLKVIDLQLITNLDVVSDYERNGIKWDYWQIGFEMPEGDIVQNVRDYFSELGRQNPFDGDSLYPALYLASVRTPAREVIADAVFKAGGVIMQPGDPYATLYNFSTSTYAYRCALAIVSDNGFKSKGFVSNRLFQALASGGGVVLQQHVDGLDELTGLIANTHYIEWHTIDDLKIWLDRIKNADAEHQLILKIIKQAGTEFVHENFSFDAQVIKLMNLIRKHLGDNPQLKDTVALQYVGRSMVGFGLGSSFPTGNRYEYKVGHLLYVHQDDLAAFFTQYPADWRRMELE